MKKIIILVPVYNDWESLSKLLSEINISINGFDKMIFDCVIINDASTLPQPEIKKNSNFNSIKIISMIENRGHARCNAFGLQYISKNFTFDHLILMDGDGEDRPVEIQSLLKKALEYENSSVVAKRIKRSEGPLFQYLYQMHKTITFLFTGKKIHFGNYSCLTKKDVNILSHQPSLWSSFSGSLSKHINNLKEIDSIRGLRYFGPSKMSLFKLLIHSFSIIAVFKNQVFLRSAIILIFISLLNTKFYLDFLNYLQIIIVVFNLLIFLTSLRENEKDFKNSHLNKKNNHTDIH